MHIHHLLLVCGKFLQYFVVRFANRDFAIRNCLVSGDMTIKVGDYGLAEELFDVRDSDYYVVVFLSLCFEQVVSY